MSLAPHPLAELIPAMTDDEYQELRDDIRNNGQREPITVYEGKILDGRHRYRACAELGLNADIREFDGGDPAKYVISYNLARRHLTSGQRAHAALGLLDYEKARAKERQRESGGAHPVTQNSAEPGRSREATAEAGRKFGVSRDSVEKAQALTKSRPDLAEKVRAGDTTLNAAVTEMRAQQKPPRTEASQDAPQGRALKLAEKSRERLERAVGACNGLARGADDLKVEQAMCVASPEDIKGWDDAFRDASAAIKRLRARIKGVTNA